MGGATVGSQGGTGATSRQHGNSGWGTLAIGLAGSAAMFTSTTFMGLNLPVIGAIYLATLVAVSAVARRDIKQKRDSSASCLALVATIAMGPVGCVAAGLLSVMQNRQRPDTKLLDDWYERISLATKEDPITRLCEDVSVGRTIGLVDAPPVSFHGTVSGGPLGEQQTVLGLIARRFHFEYLPVLRAALVSPQPIIRVQAAAVAAHIRPTLAEEFRGCLAELPTVTRNPEAALGLLHRMELAIGSGLLDAGDEKLGLAALESVSVAVVQGLVRPSSPALLRAIEANPGLGATAERLLMTRGRFADLRMLRSSVRALRSRNRARVRRLQTTASSAGVAAQ